MIVGHGIVANRRTGMCRHTLQDECRILLVHGLLHLLGFDHEIGAEESINMAEAERYILHSLQWKVHLPHMPSGWQSSTLITLNQSLLMAGVLLRALYCKGLSRIQVSIQARHMSPSALSFAVNVVRRGRAW
jgi:hypothetical protein